MRFNGYWNELREVYRTLQFPWEAGPFPGMQVGRKRDILSPQSFSSSWIVFTPDCLILWFSPLSSINLCFFLNVDAAKSTAVVTRFMSILNCPQSSQSHAEHDWWQCLSPESIPSFSLCPALLLCFQTARNPHAAPRIDQKSVLIVLDLQIQIFAFKSSDI